MPIDKEALIAFCGVVRKAFEGIPQSEFSSDSSLGCVDFPAGCCDDASQVLASLIADEFGVIPSLCRGSLCLADDGYSSHVWLEVEGFTVDITADQFCPTWTCPPVHVGEPLELHTRYKEVEIEEDGRHTSGAAVLALSGAYQAVKQRMEVEAAKALPTFDT